MRSFHLLRVTFAVGAYLAEFSSRRLLAGLALVLALGSVDSVRATPPPPARGIAGNGGGYLLVDRPGGSNTVTLTLGQSGSPADFLTLNGGDFVNLSSLAASNVFVGDLISIRARVTLESYGTETGVPYPTTATDLTVYIARVVDQPGSTPDSPLQNLSLLQLGGTNTVDSSSSTPLVKYWDGDTSPTSSPSPSLPALTGTYFDESFDQTFDATPYNLTFPDAGGAVFWLGNAYTEGPSFGRWSGFLEFTFASPSGSGVPDASRTALLLAPGTLLLLGLAGRARRRS